MGPSMLGSALQMARRKPMQDPTQPAFGGYPSAAGSIGGVMPGASPGGWSFAGHGGGKPHGLLGGALQQLQQHGHGQGPQIDTGSIGGGIGQMMGGGSPWSGGGLPQMEAPSPWQGGGMPMGQPSGQFPLNPGAPQGMMGALGRGAPMARPSVGRAVR